MPSCSWAGKGDLKKARGSLKGVASQWQCTSGVAVYLISHIANWLLILCDFVARLEAPQTVMIWPLPALPPPRQPQSILL